MGCLPLKRSIYRRREVLSASNQETLHFLSYNAGVSERLLNMG
jgi:hypothetical protein